MTTIVLTGEALLGALALGWSGMRNVPLASGATGLAAVQGILAALGLAGATWLMLQGRDRPILGSLDRVEREVLAPLFGRVNGRQIIVMSVAAGVGEELLFRGVLQAEAGWVTANLLFGLAHLGGAGTWVLALWAVVAGCLLGWLATASGGLMAPMVAHAVYDGLALSYVRWRPR